MNKKPYTALGFGCSFTAGTELLDHLIHAKADQIKRRQGWQHFDKHHARLHPRRHMFIERQRHMTWAAKVAEGLAMSYQCQAQAGQSLAETLFLVEQQIHDRVPDLMLIGATTPNRSIDFQKPGVRSWLLNLPHTWPNQSWHRPTVMDLFSDEHNLWLHLGYLLRLTSLADRIGHHRMIIAFMNDIGRELEILEQQRQPTDWLFVFQRRWQEIIEHPSVFSGDSLLGLCNADGSDQHGLYHPKLVIHRRLAGLVLPWYLSHLR